MLIEEQVLEKLKNNPGQLARNIASDLGVDKKAINSLLYGKLKNLVWQDKKYRWYPNDQPQQQELQESVKYANTPLAYLSRYYLACMDQDEGGISVFATNQFDDLDYTELDALPSANNSNIFQGINTQKLLGKIRKDRSRLTMYLGYPCTMKFVRSKKSNWSGYFVEPLFLYSVDMDSTNGAQPKIDLSFPITSVLKK